MGSAAPARHRIARLVLGIGWGVLRSVIRHIAGINYLDRGIDVL